MITASEVVSIRYRIEVVAQFRGPCCRQRAVFKVEELVSYILVDGLRDSTLFQLIVNELVDLRLEMELFGLLFIK